MRFGFLTDRTAFEFDDFKICLVPEFDDLLKHFEETALVSNGWFYGPQKVLRKSSKEDRKFKAPSPVICSSFFRMNSTHEITSSKFYTDDQYRFLILGYGFLQGLYLTPEGYSYLGRTAYELGKLNGLRLSEDDYVNGMACINKFYINSSDDDRNQMFACMHWFLIGQSYEFDWDIFDAHYKVLDGIWNLSGIAEENKRKKRNYIPHPKRPVKLAEKYKLKPPRWVELDGDGKSKLSKQRNELVHEATYDGQPIGYSYPDENYRLEFRSFNTKLIAAALGIDSPYIHAEPSHRIPCLWNIK